MFNILIIVHLRFHVTLDNMAMIKKATNRKYSGDAGKWEPPFAVGGVTYSVENSQIVKIRSAVRPSPAAPWHIPTASASYSAGFCSTMLFAAVVTGAGKWRQPGCSSAEEWRVNVSYPMEFC